MVSVLELLIVDMGLTATVVVPRMDSNNSRCRQWFWNDRIKFMLPKQISLADILAIGIYCDSRRFHFARRHRRGT